MIRIYSNDLDLERARTAALKSDDEGLRKMRNRIARSKETSLVAIAVAASEIGWKTVATEARQAAGVPAGEKLADLINVVQSRRPSRSRDAMAAGLFTPPAASEDATEDDSSEPTPDDLERLADAVEDALASA